MAHRSRRTRTFALALVTLATLTANPAWADQFKQAADGSGIDCSVSARELTRFALVDDQFASVSKISTGTPYNDFAVTNEPLRGDIYPRYPGPDGTCEHQHDRDLYSGFEQDHAGGG